MVLISHGGDPTVPTEVCINQSTKSAVILDIYSPATSPDMDYAGLGEVLISHGGNPTVHATVIILSKY